MWRRLIASHLQTLTPSRSASNKLTRFAANPCLRLQSPPIPISRAFHFSLATSVPVQKKMVEDVVPIATRHDREDLKLSLKIPEFHPPNDLMHLMSKKIKNMGSMSVPEIISCNEGSWKGIIVCLSSPDCFSSRSNDGFSPQELSNEQHQCSAYGEVGSSEKSAGAESEDDGQGGRRKKKGLTQKMKEKFTGGKTRDEHDCEHQQTVGTVTTHSEPHAQKGVMEKIKERFPAGGGS